jgi:pyruvate dehydrogenase E1 component beta subunit
MLKAAIRCDDPVIFIESASLYGMRENAWEKVGIDYRIPEGDHLVPFGVAEVRRPGENVTIVSYSHGVITAMVAASQLSEQGIEAEVIDLRTLKPLDIETVARSIRKTHHAVVVDETWREYGAGAEITARIMEDCFDDLDAPVARASGKDVPSPFSRPLEYAAMPRETDIIECVKRTLWRAVGPYHFIEGDVANGSGDNAQNGRGYGGRDSHTLAQEGRGSH